VGQTRIVSGTILSKSAGERITLAGAVTRPGLTEKPRRVGPRPRSSSSLREGDIDGPKFHPGRRGHRRGRMQPLSSLSQLMALAGQFGEVRTGPSCPSRLAGCQQLFSLQVEQVVGHDQGAAIN
jgi:hypothetical protein